MRTCPSSEDFQRRNILLSPCSLDTISRPHLQCTISTPKGAFLAQLPIVALRQIHTQHILHILLGTHLYTWVESSNVDKVSYWRSKVPGIDGNRTRIPLIQSQGFTPIYHSTTGSVSSHSWHDRNPDARPLKCVFTETQTICEGSECRKNCKVQHSYFRLQKFAKHARGFGSVVSCSRDAGNIRKKLKTFLKFLPN